MPHRERHRIYFFVAVAFWNLVGAGLFGFMINPPIALYYMQGLNTTPVHGHAALFGVYGMLGMGLMLFSLRALHPGRPWKEGPVRFAFWAINIGLMAMVVISLLPVGLMADLGVGRTRLLVCAQPGVPAGRPDQPTAMAARRRGRHLRCRLSGARMVRVRAIDRAVVQARNRSV